MIVIGEKTACGNYRRILSAGEIHLSESKTRSIYAAGEVNLNNAQIKKIRAAGEVNAKDCAVGNAKVVGEINFKGICKGGTIAFMGELNSESLECRILKTMKQSSVAKNNGKPFTSASINGYVKAVTFEQLIGVKLNCDYSFTNIISTALLSSADEIVCDTLHSFGGINTECINADKVFILLNPNIHVNTITGTIITVSNTFRPDKAFSAIPKTSNYVSISVEREIVEINEIEGDSISLQCVKAQSVRGSDIVIGDMCIIDTVEYSGKLTVSKKAVVNNTIKL